MTFANLRTEFAERGAELDIVAIIGAVTGVASVVIALLAYIRDLRSDAKKK